MNIPTEPKENEFQSIRRWNNYGVLIYEACPCYIKKWNDRGILKYEYSVKDELVREWNDAGIKSFEGQLKKKQECIKINPQDIRSYFRDNNN